MIAYVKGVVTVVSPLEVRLHGEADGQRTVMVGTWTPTVGMTVLVSVDATTRARLFAHGPITP